MSRKKKFHSDEELLQMLENDELSDIELLSDEDDGWEPEKLYERDINLDDEENDSEC
ncbi:unnamed protein product [Ceutorhynchus assimilis]|uniref:Uncharacterized protein n=1 Tax=Ceutorhynchus assimilis TaxID=467358 RepID=A0A9N9QJ61_9CUCU|nr:unnamed protein product [Ceutorhynchus assimilis]